MRSLAREVVFKVIFSRLFNPSDEGLFVALSRELNDKDKDFAKSLLDSVEKNMDKYLSEIEKLSIGYALSRVINTDKCALLIGMAELNDFPETDKATIIDEAVKLSAKFSTENSTNFVNGILAKYSRSI